MGHLNEDKLLEYALELISDRAESSGIMAHIDSCIDCRARLEEIKGDIDLIGSVRPNHPVLQHPVRKPRRRFIYASVRAAALIVFGMTLGYSLSAWVHDKPADVTSSYIQLSPPPDSTLGFAAADATEIYSGAYGNIPANSD